MRPQGNRKWNRARYRYGSCQHQNTYGQVRRTVYWLKQGVYDMICIQLETLLSKLNSPNMAVMWTPCGRHVSVDVSRVGDVALVSIETCWSVFGYNCRPMSQFSVNATRGPLKPCGPFLCSINFHKRSTGHRNYGTSVDTASRIWRTISPWLGQGPGLWARQRLGQANGLWNSVHSSPMG